MKRLKKTPVEEFNYKLPENLIGQKPIKPRDQARLLILDKKNGSVEHKIFYNIIDYLKPGDVLVLNNSKVIPARLTGQKINQTTKLPTSKIEILLLNNQGSKTWIVLTKGKTKIGQEIIFKNNIKAKIIKPYDYKSWLVKFNCSDKKIFAIGELPLPPYIKEKSKPTDYQTIYAKFIGSVASPTAGLHFTKKLIKKIKQKGVKLEYITLHIGLGTFLPVENKYIQDHQMHSELAIINKKTADNINQAKQSGHRIIAVGTTSLRTLEAFTSKNGLIKSGKKSVNIFIYPGYKFKIVNSLITNFHLPKSTLLMLVSALADKKLIKKAYQEAIKKEYKFFSFGDAMFIE